MVKIIDATQGKIRDKKVDPRALQKMQFAAQLTDPNLSIMVVSGGQDAKGTGKRRTGSTRHDIKGNGMSDTADIVLMRNGKKVLPGQDRELYKAYFKNAASVGFTGMGHYSWGIHVGGGSRAAWGPTTGSASIDRDFRDAIRSGWANPYRGEIGGAPVDMADGQEKAPYREAPAPQDPYDPYSAEDRAGGAITVPSNAVTDAPTPRTYVEDLQQVDKTPERYNFFEGVGAHYESTGLTPQVTRWMQESGMDPSFQIGEEQSASLTKTYPSQYHEFLLDSGSDYNLRTRTEWVNEDMVRQARIAQSGGVANAAQGLVAGAVDPIPLAVGVATGGTGSGVIGASRVGRMAVGAASGAASDAGMDLAVGALTDNPYSDPAMSGAFGGLFGALGGVLSRAPASQLEAQMAYDLAAKGRNPDALPLANTVDDTDFIPVQLGGHGGAAVNPEIRDNLIPEKRAEAVQIADESVPRGFGWKAVRQDVVDL